MRTIRVDNEVRARLDAIREQYGDRNYSDAIRRTMRWDKIVKGEGRSPGLSAASEIRESLERLWRP